MTEPAPRRPVPGPPRPVPGPVAPAPDQPEGGAPRADLADLAERPVAEHVAAYEAEYERLQRQLSTIDQL